MSRRGVLFVGVVGLACLAVSAFRCADDERAPPAPEPGPAPRVGVERERVRHATPVDGDRAAEADRVPLPQPTTTHGVVRGRVLASDGVPVALALVRAAPRWESEWVVCDEHGSFVLPGVLAGEGVVVWGVSPDGLPGNSRPLDVAPEVFTDDIVVRLPAPRPIRVTGRVVDGEGNVLTGCWTNVGYYVGEDETTGVSLGTVFMQLPTDDTPAGRLRRTIGAPFEWETHDDGTFDYVIDATARAVIVRADHRDFMEQQSEFTPLPADSDRLEIVIPLVPERWIKGTVVDGSGEPVAGAEVVWDEMGDEVLATSEEDGSFKFPLDDNDEYDFWVRAKGRVPVAAVISTFERSTPFVLHRAAELQGVVVRADGSPASGATVRADPSERLDENPRGARADRSATTDAEGRFVIRNVWEREWSVVAVPGTTGVGSFVQKRIRGARPSDGDVTITVNPGESISGRVVDPAGTAIAGAIVEVRHRYGSRWSWTGGDTDVSGAFAIGGLEEGQYTLRLRAAGDGAAEFVARELSEIDAGTSGLSITVQSGRAISGLVVDRGGAPVAGRTVVAMRASGERKHHPEGPSAVTGDDGTFRIGGLEDEAYRLHLTRVYPDVDLAYLEGGERVPAPAEGLRLVLSHGPTIRGTVTVGGGALAEGVRVHVACEGERWSSSTKTDADGHFAVYGLHPHETYRVRARRDGYVSDEREGVRPDGAAVELHLRPE